MRSLSVQVQPDRAPGMDMAGVTRAFELLVARTDLVQHHAFSAGTVPGPYFNFTFGTNRAAELWAAMRELLYESAQYGPAMAAASMAMCSSETGWEQYVQLYHWDPAVATVAL